MPVGGNPINDGGQVVGGIGVSGGTYQQDRDMAKTALHALEFEMDA